MILEMCAIWVYETFFRVELEISSIVTFTDKDFQGKYDEKHLSISVLANNENNKISQYQICECKFSRKIDANYSKLFLKII